MGFLTIVSLLLYVVAHMDLGDSPRHTNVWVGVNSFIIVVGIFSVNLEKLFGDSHSLFSVTLSTVSVQQSGLLVGSFMGTVREPLFWQQKWRFPHKMKYRSLHWSFFRWLYPYSLNPVSPSHRRTPWGSPCGEWR